MHAERKFMQIFSGVLPPPNLFPLPVGHFVNPEVEGGSRVRFEVKVEDDQPRIHQPEVAFIIQQMWF